MACYGEARRAALEWRAAAESRALVDQAKGRLMQALGCSAEDALGKLRQISQEQNHRVTEVAQRIIDSRAGGRPGTERGRSAAGRRRTRTLGQA